MHTLAICMASRCAESRKPTSRTTTTRIPSNFRRGHQKMSRQTIHTSHAPQAIGPYSQAIRAGDTVYLSGQIPLDPKSGQLVEGIEEQAHQVFKNLRAVATAAGASLDDMVKLSILLADLGDFAKSNQNNSELLSTAVSSPRDVSSRGTSARRAHRSGRNSGAALAVVHMQDV